MYITEMAYNRSDFKNKVQEYITGAFFEYLTADFFERNKETKWIEHKRNEVRSLLGKLSVVQFFSTKGTWSKKKAALEVVENLKSKSEGFFTVATNSFEKYFKKKPTVQFSKEDKKDLVSKFVDLVNEEIESWF